MPTLTGLCLGGPSDGRVMTAMHARRMAVAVPVAFTMPPDGSPFPRATASVPEVFNYRFVTMEGLAFWVPENTPDTGLAELILKTLAAGYRKAPQ